MTEKLIQLQQIIQDTPPVSGDVYQAPNQDIWVSNNVTNCRVGFLFPGQGSQRLNATRVLIERYDWAREFLQQADNWLTEMGFTGISNYLYQVLEKAETPEQLNDWKQQMSRADIASPIICFCSLVWQRYLAKLGITPQIVAGHSLGELTAFQSASAFDEKTLLCLAALRGQAMLSKSDNPGGMLSFTCDRNKAQELLQGVSGYIIIANINSPQQTVVSGDLDSIEEVIVKAQQQNIQTYQLKVSNAFHSTRMTEAAEFLEQQAQLPEKLSTPSVPLFSSIDGKPIKAGINLKAHFAKQVVSAVDFIALVESVAQECDLLIEVGSGRVLSGLVNSISQQIPCLPIESKGGCDRDLNIVLANFFIRSGSINWDELYENRLIRPFVAPSDKKFIENQCERPFAVSEEDLITPVTTAPESELDLVATLTEYFDQRGTFLAEVIQADLETLPFEHISM